MPLKIGDWVRLIALDKEGQIVECLRGGEYKVAIRGLTVLCREKDVCFLPEGPDDEEKEKTKRKREKRGREKVGGEAPSLDLHGMRVEDAMKVVEERINQAILSDADALRVVHGKGTGKIQSALHRYLRG